MATKQPPDPAATLMKAARALFLAEGMAGLSVRRIAERAGMSTMAVYSHFGGKDGIIGALYDEGFDTLRSAQARVPVTRSAIDRVLGLCRAFRNTAATHPHHYALMLGAHSGSFTPSLASAERATATMSPLREAVSATKRTPPDIEGDVARLLAYCHGWATLSASGLFTSLDDADAAFDSGVLHLMGESARSSRNSSRRSKR
jgi:AcrR family transcriptional regulator